LFLLSMFHNGTTLVPAKHLSTLDPTSSHPAKRE
jgi:hypothetical protein